MEKDLKERLTAWAHEYNDPKYFQEDPIIFPTHFAERYRCGEASLADIEISALLASHLAWGRRAMIVRDSRRLFDEMEWRPYEYAASYLHVAEALDAVPVTVNITQSAAYCSDLAPFDRAVQACVFVPVFS